MKWKMYTDEKARTKIRTEHKLEPKDVALLIMSATDENGEHIVDSTYNPTTFDYDHETEKWTQKDIDEYVRGRLWHEGQNVAVEGEELYLKESMSEDVFDEHLNRCIEVVVETYDLRELYEQHGFKPKFKSKGRGRGWHGQPARHSMARRKGL